jgi:hypothetical protein
MAETPIPVEAPQEPEASKAERAYAVICLVSLLLVVVIMMLDGIGVWSVLPMLIGGVAFLLRWRGGPPLVLFVFVWLAPTRFIHNYEPDTFLSVFVTWGQYGPGRSMDLSASLEDVVLCLALLAYTAACYRALALSHSILPPDHGRPRRPATQPGAGAPRRKPSPLIPRPGEPASPVEVPIFFAALAVAALAGLGLWVVSAYLPRWWGLSPAASRSIGTFWIFILVLTLAIAFFRYRGRRRAPPDENLLYLQDQLWRQTRQEQGTLNRWLVWARQRGQRRKEQ